MRLNSYNDPYTLFLKNSIHATFKSEKLPFKDIKSFLNEDGKPEPKYLSKEDKTISKDEVSIAR